MGKDVKPDLKEYTKPTLAVLDHTITAANKTFAGIEFGDFGNGEFPS